MTALEQGLNNLEAALRPESEYALQLAAIPMLLMLALFHPGAVRARPSLWDCAKDLLIGIESGGLPKPNWFDAAKQHIQERDSHVRNP